MGTSDGVVSTLPHVRNLVHAVFDARWPHGSAYASVSSSVPGSCSATGGARHSRTFRCTPVLPYLVRAAGSDASAAGDLRAELGIPGNATVFGRYGGHSSFNIPFVHSAIVEVASARPELYFLFANTKRFSTANQPNLLFLPSLKDAHRKASFVRTSDAMLHARHEGETFGLAVAEFNVAGKPVITSSEAHDNHRARAHLDALAGNGLLYHDKASLMGILLGFNRTAARAKDWRAPKYAELTPSRVMQRFDELFLQGG